jgi:hypothetical protein
MEAAADPAIYHSAVACVLHASDNRRSEVVLYSR